MAEKKHTPPDDFAVNRKAWHDYTVLERIECGIQLTGTEVKVVRHGEASLSGAYGAVLGGELFVCGMNIPVYEFGNRFNHDPRRNRKLLVHRKEVLPILGLLFGLFMVFEGLSDQFNAFVYARRAGQAAWWFLAVLAVLTVAFGVALLTNPWWESPAVLKRVIGIMMLFASVVSIIRTILTWPFKSV